MDIKERFSAVRTTISETHTKVLKLLVYLLDECDVNIIDNELFDKLYTNLTVALQYIEDARNEVRDAEKEFDGKVVDK